MGRYDELPDHPNGWGSCVVYHATLGDFEKLDLSSGCKQALEIYNHIRKTELTLVEIVKANCQSFSHYCALYVTFRIRDPKEEDCYMMFQGGINEDGDPKDAAIRELREQTGLKSAEVIAENSPTSSARNRREKKIRSITKGEKDMDDIHATMDEYGNRGLKISILGDTKLQFVDAVRVPG